MIVLNARWLCGRLRRNRKFWVVVSLAAILLLVGRNLRWDRTTDDDDVGKFSRDGENYDLITFVDLKKAFDEAGRGPALTATAFVDRRKAFDISSPSRSSVKKRLNSRESKRTPDYRKNTDSVDNSIDLQKVLDMNRTESVLRSGDLQKAFDSKQHSSVINSADHQNASVVKKRRFSQEELRKIFAYRLTGQEKVVVFEILQALDTVSAKLQLPYFLCGGTLLGSFRHHDLTPWDDDVDVYMNLTERDAIFSGLSSLSPDFEVFSAGYRLKVYSQWSKASSKYPWKYPYVDINFFQENATHIIDSDPMFVTMAYRKETIFPLHRRPLGGLFFYAPYDTYSYLAHTYTNITLCSTSHYDHRNEKLFGDGGTKITVCRRLRTFVPFVYRTRDLDSGGILETLKLSDTELRAVVVSEPQYVVGDPFSLVSIPNETRETNDDRSDVW